MSVDPPSYPPTLIYGLEAPEIRFRSEGGTQRYFCLRNRNLHLCENDFDEGTFEAGNLLGVLCRELCTSQRTGEHQPCPAFARSWKIGTENKGLASVEIRPVPLWEECAGVRALLDMSQTDEERFFLKAYLDDKYGDEADWRDGLVAQWNAHWNRVENGWDRGSRRAKFDQMTWWTLRFPALVPQVWLNWLHAAPEPVLKALDENPSRVDFMAFWRGERHVIEIDGPSHYAAFDETTRTYRVDEREYARNLKIERSLRAEGWQVARIGRSEVRDAMPPEGVDYGDLGSFVRWSSVLKALPFYRNEDYPETFRAEFMGLPEIDRPLPTPVPALGPDDDIPF